MKPFMFPRWTAWIRPAIAAAGLITPVYLALFVWYAFSPQTTDVGYRPEQPVPFSHAIHAGKLGMDCRYCHSTVEKAAHSPIPPTATCMNCHAHVKTASPKLQLVRESYATGMPVEWRRVHDLPDYVYFNHSAHVTRGIGCSSCHGRIDKMEIVQQDQKLSMGWCLDCHRAPEQHIRPKDQITNMEWKLPQTEQVSLGRKLLEEYHINPSVHCSVCHR